MTKATIGHGAVLQAARITSLTAADEESLRTGQWAEGSATITLGRLFYFDLPKAMRAPLIRKRGYSKDQRETLQTEASLLIVARNGGRLPLKRDWLDPNGGEGLTEAAWQTMFSALRASENAAGYATTKRAQKARTGWDGNNLATDLSDESAATTTAERAVIHAEADEYQRQWSERSSVILEASLDDIRAAMGLSLSGARALVRDAYGLTDAACAHQWDVSILGVPAILTRGRKEIRIKYAPPEAGADDEWLTRFDVAADGETARRRYSANALREAIRAASAALTVTRERHARAAIETYRDNPNRISEREASEAAAVWTSYAPHLPDARHALLAALTRALSHGAEEVDTGAVAERSALLASSIERLLVAEDRRELENVRLGRRGILAGHVDMCADAPLPPGGRVWTVADDSLRVDLAAQAVERAAGAEHERTLTPEQRLAALKDRSRTAQRNAAVSIALDAAYSQDFHGQPAPHTRALLADEKLHADAWDRRAVKRAAPWTRAAGLAEDASAGADEESGTE